MRQNLADSMDDYGYLIVKALITDIDPDARVKDSMNKINAAKRDKEATMEESEGAKIRVVKRLKQMLNQNVYQVKVLLHNVREIIRGFKESVEDFQKTLKAVSHEEIMHFVLLTQYFDTLNHIGSNGKNTSILIPHSPAAMKDFQDQITQGTFIGTKLGEATEGDK
ncbi:MAG: hypothetical protein IPG07_16460 [Crocinitomicaceae bacterium]|nr:hypothetical protein [Crocinitomicaceae bacterium]